MRIKTKDTVMVITGKDKGKQGTVLEIDNKYNKVKIQGIALITKHLKPKQRGDKGSIVRIESFIHISNIMPICATTKKPCRVQYKVNSTGDKVRFSQRSGEPL